MSPFSGRTIPGPRQPFGTVPGIALSPERYEAGLRIRDRLRDRKIRKKEIIAEMVNIGKVLFDFGRKAC